METRDTKGAGPGLQEMGSVAIDFHTEIKNVQKQYTSAKPR
jgi:hypothetical protein